MILRRLLAALLLCLGAASAPAAHLQFNLQDFTTGAVGSRKITVTPVGIGNNGIYLVSGDPLSFTNSAAGLLTISNVLAGDYRIAWGGLLGGSVVVTVPTNDAVVNASEITITTSTNSSPTTTAHSQAAANARFILREGGYGTNTTLSNVVLLGTITGITTGTGEVSTAQLNTASNLLSTKIGARQGRLLFYHSFSDWPDQAAITNFISTSGHNVRTYDWSGNYSVSNYVTNGWFGGNNMLTNDNSVFVNVQLTNLGPRDTFVIGARVRYRLCRETNAVDFDRTSIPMPYYRRDNLGMYSGPGSYIPGITAAGAHQFNVLGTYESDILASDFYISAAIIENNIPNTQHYATEMLRDTNKVEGFPMEVGYLGEGQIFADRAGMLTFGYSTNLDNGSWARTNLYWQIHQHTNRTHYLEFRELWVYKITQPGIIRRLLTNAPYGPGITNSAGVPALALDAGENVTLTTNGNRLSIAAPALGGGDVSTAELNTASNAVLTAARDRADTDLLFYDSFSRADSFGTTNWTSDSGHSVRIMQPLAGDSSADPYASGYFTNGWLGLNASSNDSTFYLLVTLTNLVKTEPIEMGVEWRFKEAGSGSNWSAADNESFTLANVGGEHPNWGHMVHIKFLQECTYFYASTWTNGAGGVGSLLPSGFPAIPFATRLRAELTSPVPHQSSVIYWGDNSITATMDGFSTNLWYTTLDAQTGTNFFFQLWQDNYASARRWIEFNRVWIKKVPDRRIPAFAGRYGPGITNKNGIAALALDAGSNVTLTTNGNRISIAAGGATLAQVTNVSTNSVVIVPSGSVTVETNATPTNVIYTIGYGGAGITLSDVTNGTPFGFDASVGTAGDFNAAGTVNAGGTNIIAQLSNLVGQSNQWALLTWANSISNLVETKQNGDADLTNWAGITTASKQESNGFLTTISGLASKTFTNVPLGGTNISVRTEGGTNFIDTTGELNNWSPYPTSMVSSTAQTIANAVTNNTLARTNSTEFIRTNLLTSVDGNIVVRQDGAGGVTLSNAMSGTLPADAAGMLTNDGAGVKGWMAIPSGGGSTQMVAAAIGTLTATNIVMYTNASGIPGTIRFVTTNTMPGSGSQPYLGSLNTTNFVLSNGLAMITLNTNGRVGFGDAAPARTVQVNGTIGASSTIYGNVFDTINNTVGYYSWGGNTRAWSKAIGVLMVTDSANDGVGVLIGTNNITGAAAWTFPLIKKVNAAGTAKAALLIQSATNNAGADFAVWGELSTSNSITLGTNSAITGPVGVTNGLSAIWNSNGVATYIRSSVVGYTTNEDTVLKVH